MKKLISFCMAFLLVLCWIPVIAEAATTYTYGDWEYTVDSGVATITKYNGSATTVTVPSSINNYLVTVIGRNAFKGNTTMRMVSFPDTLLKIDSYAFEGCIGLTSITLPKKLTTLGYHAFKNCTHVTSIVINSESLSNVDTSSEPFYGVGSASHGVSVTFANGCTRVPSCFFNAESGVNYAANITSVTLADTITYIGYLAFADCAKITNVVMSDNVVEIGFNAFDGCVSLTDITLPRRLAILGRNAFRNCTHVESISIESEALKNLYDGAEPFYGVGSATSGVSVTFTNGCKRVPSYLFDAASGANYAANITTVSLADTVTYIGYLAFANCININNIEMSDNVIEIGFNAFDGCTSLTSVLLPKSLTTLGSNAFRNCTHVQSITIESESLKNLYDSAEPFYAVASATNGVSVTFANGCTRIPRFLFNADSDINYATNITSVVIAPTVTEIGNYAFGDCIKLSTIRFEGKAPIFENNVFKNVTAIAYYPANDPTWTSSVMQDYGGSITWTPYGNSSDVTRLAGDTRFETALEIAEELKAILNAEKFGSIIIASGTNFVDALTGSYLATVKSAPILLSWGQGGKYSYLDDNNIAYVKENLKPGGTVYILGSEDTVPGLYEDALYGYQVKRLGGETRFDTNLLILKEAGVKSGEEILVCTSTNFADSLSASAVGKPILLVFNEFGKLYGDQPQYLSNLKNCTFTVIGGENAVSQRLADAVGKYGKVTRLAGANRFATSALVARKYLNSPNSVVLAYAWNYPDGLCGGPLAFAMGVPLILTMDGYEGQAVGYVKEIGIGQGYVLGSDELISEGSIQKIFTH